MTLRRPGHESGMALIVVLWTLLLLGVITASLSTQTRKQAYLTRNGEALARAEAAAEGGIIRGISALLDPRSESRWAADGSSHSFVLDGIVVDVRIVDEAGKLDLNTGAPETLAALLEVLGAGEVGQSIAQGLSEQRSGARTGQPRPLEVTAELLAIPGMTPALFEQVAPFVTVLTHAAGVDPTFAAPPMLAALAGPGADGTESKVGSGGPGSALTAGATSVSQVTESQHALYAISATAMAGPARFARSTIIRLTHSAETPFLIHAWSRAANQRLARRQ